MSNIERENAHALEAWNTNAGFWDERMAEGNDFFSVLVWPAVKNLLQPVSGERILDVACGNGLISRRLAEGGVDVTACDFSDEMIRRARERSPQHSIPYRLIDLTDGEALRQLGTFDGVVCNMALMDLADIRPLMESLALLLSQHGRFVFSVLHPCFNNPATVQTSELEDRSGTIVTTYSVKISRYMTPFTQLGLAIHGQPVAQPYFHRPLSALLAPALQAGLVLDGIEERAFPPESLGGSLPLSWNGHFREIPAVLVARLRPGGRRHDVASSD